MRQNDIMCLLDAKQKKTHIISVKILPKTVSMNLVMQKQPEKSEL